MWLTFSAVQLVNEYNLPTTAVWMGEDIPALFPALILTWREHTFTFGGRMMVNSVSACPGWCCLVSFKTLPVEVIRVIRKNSGILLVHTTSTCIEHNSDQVDHSSCVTTTCVKDSWTHIIDADVYNISCYCDPNSDTPNYNITRNWNIELKRSWIISLESS